MNFDVLKSEVMLFPGKCSIVTNPGSKLWRGQAIFGKTNAEIKRMGEISIFAR